MKRVSKQVREEAIFLLDVAASYSREELGDAWWLTLNDVAQALFIDVNSAAFALADFAYRAVMRELAAFNVACNMMTQDRGDAAGLLRDGWCPGDPVERVLRIRPDDTAVPAILTAPPVVLPAGDYALPGTFSSVVETVRDLVSAVSPAPIPPDLLLHPPTDAETVPLTAIQAPADARTTAALIRRIFDLEWGLRRATQRLIVAANVIRDVGICDPEDGEDDEARAVIASLSNLLRTNGKVLR